MKSEHECFVEQIRVVIADDHAVIREGLTKILSSQKDIKIVAEAADGEEVCKLYNRVLPDVLILDLRLPKRDGLQVLYKLMARRGWSDTVPRPAADFCDGERRRFSKPRVIIITSYDSEHDISKAVRAGAKGFLVKTSPPEEIREAVRRVARGETFFPPEIGLKLAQSMSYPELSGREIQVLENLVQGRSNKQIGSALYISEGTVKYHIKSLLKKLDAVGRAEAIAVAARRGLVQMG